MDIATIIQSKYLIAALSGIGGIFATIFIQNWLNRRALFTYNVFHNQVGLSADDAIYGSVKVTWNNNPIARLYLSTIELSNESSKDFESVVVRVFTNNTNLLTQSSQIIGTTRILEFSEGYQERISVPTGEEPTEDQFHLYCRQREYLIPTMNRGQKVKIEFLNAADTDERPCILLEILQKGIICKFKVAQQLFMGVPQQTAALVGSIVGLFTILIMLYYMNNIWLSGVAVYFIGLIVLVPGAYTIKIYRKVKKWLAG